MGRLVTLFFLFLVCFVISCGDARTFEKEDEEVGTSTAELTFSNGLTTPIASMSSWTNGNFGACGSSYYLAGKCHIGNDIHVAAGTPVLAVAAGTLISISGTQSPSSNCPSGWGYDYGIANTCNVAYAVLHHNGSGQPFVSVYGHMRYAPNIPVGTRFTAGSVIGVVGKYYNTDGTAISVDHLHWGIRPGSSTPTDWGRTACGTSQPASATFPSGCSSGGFVQPGTYMLNHFSQSLPYSYDLNAYACPGPVTGGSSTNWVYSCGGSQVSFTQGSTVHGLIRINNIQPNTQFRYKVTALKNDVFSWDWTAGWNNSGSTGWDKSYFWPSMVNAQPGNWSYQFWVDAGAGFSLLDTRYFAVIASATPYSYTGQLTTCRGPVTGSASTNWVYTCQNPTSTFNINDPATALIRVNNIGADFRWKTDVYANGSLRWTDTTGWSDVGEWGWEKAFYWPTTGSVWLSGSWEYRIHIDTGSGFNYLTSAYFTVN